MKAPDWRSNTGSSRIGTNPSPAKQGGTPSRPASTTRTVGTKPMSNFMGGGSGPYNDCNLAVFKNRRCGHKGK